MASVSDVKGLYQWLLYYPRKEESFKYNDLTMNFNLSFNPTLLYYNISEAILKTVHWA